jgi:hypothetical protein
MKQFPESVFWINGREFRKAARKPPLSPLLFFKLFEVVVLFMRFAKGTLLAVRLRIFLDASGRRVPLAQHFFARLRLPPGIAVSRICGRRLFAALCVLLSAGFVTLSGFGSERPGYPILDVFPRSNAVTSHLLLTALCLNRLRESMQRLILLGVLVP